MCSHMLPIQFTTGHVWQWGGKSAAQRCLIPTGKETPRVSARVRSVLLYGLHLGHTSKLSTARDNIIHLHM